MSLSTAALIFPEKLFPSPTWFPPHYSLGKQLNLVPRWQMTSWMSSLCFVASCGQASLPKSLHCHLQQHPILWKERAFQEHGKIPKIHLSVGVQMWICVTLCALLHSLHLLRIPNPDSHSQAHPSAAPVLCRKLAAQEFCGFKAKKTWNLEQKQSQPKPACYLQFQGFMFQTLLNRESVKGEK